MCVRKGVTAAGCQRSAINLHQHPCFHYWAKLGQLGPIRGQFGPTRAEPTHHPCCVIQTDSQTFVVIFFICTLLLDRDHYSATTWSQVNKYCSRPGWCKHIEKDPVSPACGEAATVTCLSRAGSTGRGQRLLLLLPCRPRIGEHSGHDTKTGGLRFIWGGYGTLNFTWLEINPAGKCVRITVSVTTHTV